MAATAAAPTRPAAFLAAPFATGAMDTVVAGADGVVTVAVAVPTATVVRAAATVVAGTTHALHVMVVAVVTVTGTG